MLRLLPTTLELIHEQWSASSNLCEKNKSKSHLRRESNQESFQDVNRESSQLDELGLTRFHKTHHPSLLRLSLPRPDVRRVAGAAVVGLVAAAVVEEEGLALLPELGAETRVDDDVDRRVDHCVASSRRRRFFLSRGGFRPVVSWRNVV